MITQSEKVVVEEEAMVKKNTLVKEKTVVKKRTVVKEKGLEVNKENIEQIFDWPIIRVLKMGKFTQKL